VKDIPCCATRFAVMTHSVREEGERRNSTISSPYGAKQHGRQARHSQFVSHVNPQRDLPGQVPVVVAIGTVPPSGNEFDYQPVI
jgi:hypothetical protein